MEPSGVKERKRIQLPAVPVFIQTTGQLDVDHRIFVSCRDGKIYVIKDGKLSDQIFDIESVPVSMIYMSKSINIAGMNSKIHSFFTKGKKNFSIYLPHPIVCMERMEMAGTKQVKCLLVALNNGEIRLYNQKYLLNIIKTDEVV